MPHDRDPLYAAVRATPVEVVRLVEAEPDLTRRALLAVLYGCGIRASEAASLHWSDLTGAGASARLTVITPHGTPRTVPVPAFALRHLDAARPGFADRKLMFPADNGWRMTRGQVSEVVAEAGQRAGRSDIYEAAHLRSLRAQHLIAGGTSEQQVRAFLGTAKAA